MKTIDLKPRVVQAGEARVLDQLPGERITILLSGSDTGGAFAMCQDEVAPGGGTPLHIHHHEDETFYVLEGEIEIQAGAERFSVSPGASVYLPKGVPHAYKNVGTQPSKTLFILTPAGLESFFAEVEPLFKQSEPDMTAVFAMAGKYQIEIVGPELSAIGQPNGHQKVGA